VFLSAEETSRSRSRSVRNRRTRKRNAAKRKAQEANAEQANAEQSDDSGRSQSPPRTIAASPEPNSDDEEASAAEARSQSKQNPSQSRLYLQSPCLDAAEGASSAPSQGLESPFDQERFLAHASRIVGEDVTDRNTQDVQEMLRVLRSDQTPSVDAARRSSSVRR
jgi:hypothetical protein